MRTVRTRLIALAIVCFVVPAFAQSGGAQPAKDPAKPAAEPAKPTTPAAKPVEPAKPTTPTTATPTVATAAAIGKPAPDFKLKDAEGKEHKLADYKGKVVVLEWTNSECPVCGRHAKAKTAENVMANFKDKGVAWLNVDSNDGCDTKVDGIKKFCKDNGLTGAWLLDPSGATGKAYGAKTTPHMFVLDKDGKVAYMGAMDDDNDGSKGAKAKNYVKDAVDSLLKGSAVATATTEPYGCTVKYKK